MHFIIFNLIKSAMFGNLTRAFISIFFILIGVLVFPSTSSWVMDTFNLRTKEMLKEKVKVQKEDIGRLMDSNQNLEQTLTLVEVQKGVELKSIEEFFKNKETAHKDVAKRIQSKAQQIYKVQYATLPADASDSKPQIRTAKLTTTKHKPSSSKRSITQENPNAPPTEIEKTISRIQIAAVWDSYCSFNVNQSCRTSTTI